MYSFLKAFLVLINTLLISFSVAAIADASLHKGNIWAHDHYPLSDSTHEKRRLHKRATHAFAPSSPKAQVYRTRVPHLSLEMHP